MIGTTITAIRKNQSTCFERHVEKLARTSVDDAKNTMNIRRQHRHAGAGALGPVTGPVEEVVVGEVLRVVGLEERPHEKDVEDQTGEDHGREEHLRGMVWPHPTHSQLGMIRSAPSSQPMYQSGCTA